MLHEAEEKKKQQQQQAQQRKQEREKKHLDKLLEARLKASRRIQLTSFTSRAHARPKLTPANRLKPSNNKENIPPVGNVPIDPYEVVSVVSENTHTPKKALHATTPIRSFHKL